jgi:hypothetical protein
MSKPKQIEIKETLKELKVLHRNSGELLSKRFLILIELKKHEKTGISKLDLVALTSLNHNSITKWRNKYIAEGITPFLSHGRKGFKKSVISDLEHKAMEGKLKNPNNGLRGYVELLEWTNAQFKTNHKYITVVKYVQRHFGTKIKVARKSHVKKDEELVDNFKKSSVKSYKK